MYLIKWEIVINPYYVFAYLIMIYTIPSCLDSHGMGWMTIPYTVYIYTYMYTPSLDHGVVCLCLYIWYEVPCVLFVDIYTIMYLSELARLSRWKLSWRILRSDAITNMGAQAIRIQQLWDMLDAWQRKVMSAKSTMDRYGPFGVWDCAILYCNCWHDLIHPSVSPSVSEQRRKDFWDVLDFRTRQIWMTLGSRQKFATVNGAMRKQRRL